MQSEVMCTDTVVDLAHIEGSIVQQENVEDFILEGVVDVSGKEKQLTLKNDCLVLGSQVNGANNCKKKDLCLSWRDVIHAIKDAKPASGKHPASFTLNYIQHHGNKTLSVKFVQIAAQETDTDKWISAINEKCQKVPGRPKKVFVVINPIGGSKTANKIYQKKVAPLFELAGIHTDVKLTERSKHALELGEHHDLSGCDAIVTVGGDGLFQEVLMGYTLRIQKEAGIDYNNPEAVFTKPKIHFGIIPAGTGNGVAGWCNGTHDEVTAALNIIRGEDHRLCTLRVHSSDKFVTLCGMQFGYGEWSDVIKRTEELRWMQKMRYPYAMCGMLFKKPRMFNCIFEYLVTDELSESPGAANGQKPEWITPTSNDSKVCGLACFTLKDPTNVNDPHGRCVDFLVNYGSGRIDLMKALYRIATYKSEIEPLPAKLELLSKIIGFRFKLISDVGDEENLSAARVKERELERILNIDGEVVYVDKPEFEVRYVLCFLYAK